MDKQDLVKLTLSMEETIGKVEESFLDQSKQFSNIFEKTNLKLMQTSALASLKFTTSRDTTY